MYSKNNKAAFMVEPLFPFESSYMRCSYSLVTEPKSAVVLTDVNMIHVKQVLGRV